MILFDKKVIKSFSLMQTGSLQGACSGKSEHQHQPHPQLLQWMWADSGIAPGGFFAAMAKMDPFRWSAKMTPDALKRDLSSLPSSHERRPVRLSLCGQTHELEFSCPESAVRWIDEAQQEISGQTQAASLGILNFHRVPFLVPAAIAVHLRLNAKTPWMQHNIFAAAAFARRVVKSPRKVVRMQADRSACRHHQSFMSWEDFHHSADQGATHFIQFACQPSEGRAVHSELAAHGNQWVCVESARFWVLFRSKSGGSAVIAFRGGDGGTSDQCDHPGSPLRSFIHGEDPELPPQLPLQALKSIISRRGVDVPLTTLTIVGYSMGCLPAIACALSFGSCSDLPLNTLSRVILFNPATMFWPLWFRPPLLSDDWWSNIPPASSVIVSYVVKDDPLSDGLPGPRGFRAPVLPGHTYFLPPKFSGADTAQNHSLQNFCDSSPSGDGNDEDRSQ
jgi:hypothetical protein